MQELTERFLPALEQLVSAEERPSLEAFMAVFESLGATAEPKIWLADGYSPGQRGNGKEWDIY